MVGSDLHTEVTSTEDAARRAVDEFQPKQLNVAPQQSEPVVRAQPGAASCVESGFKVPDQTRKSLGPSLRDKIAQSAARAIKDAEENLDGDDGVDDDNSDADADHYDAYESDDGDDQGEDDPVDDVNQDDEDPNNMEDPDEDEDDADDREKSAASAARVKDVSKKPKTSRQPKKRKADSGESLDDSTTGSSKPKKARKPKVKSDDAVEAGDDVERKSEKPKKRKAETDDSAESQPKRRKKAVDAEAGLESVATKSPKTKKASNKRKPDDATDEQPKKKARKPKADVDADESADPDDSADGESTKPTKPRRPPARRVFDAAKYMERMNGREADLKAWYEDAIDGLDGHNLVLADYGLTALEKKYETAKKTNPNTPLVHWAQVISLIVRELTNSPVGVGFTDQNRKRGVLPSIPDGCKRLYVGTRRTKIDEPEVPDWMLPTAEEYYTVAADAPADSAAPAPKKARKPKAKAESPKKPAEPTAD